MSHDGPPPHMTPPAEVGFLPGDAARVLSRQAEHSRELSSIRTQLTRIEMRQSTHGALLEEIRKAVCK